MHEGYMDKKIDGYRLTRMMMFTMVKIWAEKGPKTPEQLWPLPGDAPLMDDEDRKKLLEKFASLR
jgi:hypothetical protein